MFGKVKALGLLTSAVLLMGAVLASAAHAETEFLPSAYPAIVTGEQISTEVHPEHIFSIGAFGSLKCSGAKFTTTVKQTDDHTQLTIKPTYSNCFFLNGDPGTVTMNGCDLVVHVVSTMDIVCSGEPKHILIDVWKSMVGHLGGAETMCQYTIAPQTGLKSTNLSNTTVEGRKDVDLTFSVANIAIKRIQGSLLLCGPENPMGGAKYTGLMTLRAYEDVNGAEGKQIDFEA